MTARLQKLAAAAAAIAALVAISIALFNGPLSAHGCMMVRFALSVATAAFLILCTFGAGAVVAAMYFFYRMVGSPRPGVTVFDARSPEIQSVFSDRYLNNEGKAARTRLFIALRWFAGCWVGAALLGVAMYILHGRAL